MKAKEQANTAAPPARSATAVRGKYFNQMERGTNLVILDPDLMVVFPDSESVNRALHAFLAIDKSVKDAAPPRRRPGAASASLRPRVGAVARTVRA